MCQGKGIEGTPFPSRAVGFSDISLIDLLFLGVSHHVGVSSLVFSKLKIKISAIPEYKMSTRGDEVKASGYVDWIIGAGEILNNSTCFFRESLQTSKGDFSLKKHVLLWRKANLFLVNKEILTVNIWSIHHLKEQRNCPSFSIQER